jgi:hypothetical protein
MRAQAKGQKDLGTALREQQTGAVQTAAQAAEVQAAQNLQQVGSLASRVPALINQDLTAAATGSTQLGVNQSVIPSGVDPAAWTAAVNQLTSSDTGLQQAGAATLNNMLGYTSTNTASATALLAYVTTPEQSIEAKVAGQMPDQITLSQLSPTDLGVTGWGDIASALGIKDSATQTAAQAVEGMTVAQLGQALSAAKATGFNTEAQWRSVLSDPTASTQLRGTATMMLRMSGATGIDAAEKSVQSLTNQVQAANTITFNGQSMTVDQLLQKTTDPVTGQQVNSQVSGLIASVLSGDQTAISNLQTMSPQLLDFINNNETELKQATANVTVEEQTLATTQATNQAAFAPLAAAGFSDAQIQTMTGIDISSVSATVITPPAVLTQMSASQTAAAAMASVLQAYNELPDGAGMSAIQAIMSAKDGAQVQALTAAGLFDNTSAGYNTLMSNLKTASAANAVASTPQETPAAIETTVLGSTVSGETPATAISTINVDSTLLAAAVPSAISSISTNGSLDAAKLIKAANTGIPSTLDQVLNSAQTPDLVTQVGDAFSSVSDALKTADTTGILVPLAQAAIKGGGTPSASSISSLVAAATLKDSQTATGAGGAAAASATNFEGLDALQSGLSKLGVSTTAVQTAINTQVQTAVDTLINTKGVYPNQAALLAAANNPANWANPTTQQQLGTTLQQLQQEAGDPGLYPAASTALNALVTQLGKIQNTQMAAVTAANQAAQPQQKAQTEWQQFTQNPGETADTAMNQGVSSLGGVVSSGAKKLAKEL